MLIDAAQALRQSAERETQAYNQAVEDAAMQCEKRGEIAQRFAEEELKAKTNQYTIVRCPAACFCKDFAASILHLKRPT